MLMIGICGASGSGKSTLASALAASISASCIMLSQDSYYKNHPDMTFEERGNLNYDEPEAFEHDLLLSDQKTLRAGRPITRKGYDFTRHLRCDSEEKIEPTDVLILEGIHCFYDPGVRDALDLKIFIRVDADICLLRRVQRDILKRGRQIQGISAQYLSTVKPMFDRYIKNYINYADVIVAGGGKNKRIVDLLAHYVNSGRASAFP